MPSRFLSCVVLFALLAIGCAKEEDDSPTKRCSNREVYKECGTACEPICGRPLVQNCTLPCVSGCFCRRGSIRRRRGHGCLFERSCALRERGRAVLMERFAQRSVSNTTTEKPPE
ncbi:hypothetical protein V5799_008755 [Amblyomma americanum]|uniref:TIL domain-containing protein n=1 Tax=Amblyomma americanum TaxID=6943 RepID=A0AAQ4FCI8_AMBAM